MQELLDDYAGIWDELQRQNSTLDQSPIAKTVFSNIDSTARLKAILGKVPGEYTSPDKHSFFEKMQATFHELYQRSGMNIPEEMQDVMNSRNILSATGKCPTEIDRNMILKPGIFSQEIQAMRGGQNCKKYLKGCAGFKCG